MADKVLLSQTAACKQHTGEGGTPHSCCWECPEAGICHRVLNCCVW
jgi:hypothetical protein